eukprot:4033288-Amphidinium_carterae.4
MGAGHDPRCEWRRDRLVPLDVHSRDQVWLAEKLQGTLSQAHVRQREAYAHWGIATSADKSVVRLTRVTQSCILTAGSTIGRLGLVSKTLWVCTSDHVSWKELLVVLGRLSQILEFRRPLMFVVNDASSYASRHRGRPLPSAMVNELMRACGC